MLDKTKNIDDLIKLAFYTTDLSEMITLKDSSSMNVRRALARNENIDKNILEELLYDPVENVSYMASLNPKNKKSRQFNNNSKRPCVLCEKSEINLVCINCPELKGQEIMNRY